MDSDGAEVEDRTDPHVVIARPRTDKADGARSRRRPTAGRSRAAKVDATAVLPPARQGDDAWTPDELGEVRAELQALLLRYQSDLDVTLRQLTDIQRDSGDGAGDDQADAGAKTFEREHEMSLANNRRDLLTQVQRALYRLGDGTYGVCESCGQPISKARLQAFPSATLDVTCKQRQERR